MHINWGIRRLNDWPLLYFGAPKTRKRRLCSACDNLPPEPNQPTGFRSKSGRLVLARSLFATIWGPNRQPNSISVALFGSRDKITPTESSVEVSWNAPTKPANRNMSPTWWHRAGRNSIVGQSKVWLFWSKVGSCGNLWCESQKIILIDGLWPTLDTVWR